MGVEDFRTSEMPDDEDCAFGWVIRRASPESPLKVISLSSKIFGIRTHYFRNRTVPCLKKGCEACSPPYKQLSRWKGYLLATDQANGQQVVVEFTPPCALPLQAAAKAHGHLRGLQLTFSRVAKRANAKVMVVTHKMTVLDQHAPLDVHPWHVLSRIWGIDSKDRNDVTRGDLDDLSEDERHR